MGRIHVIVDPAEREAFRAQAKREGKSLSEWLRVAGRDRLARQLDDEALTTSDLREFFAALDHSRSDDRPEEDWDVTKERMARSQAPSIPG